MENALRPTSAAKDELGNTRSKQSNRTRNYFLLLMVLILPNACGVKQAVPDQAPPGSTSVGEPNVVFLNYELQGTPKAELKH